MFFLCMSRLSSLVAAGLISLAAFLPIKQVKAGGFADFFYSLKNEDNSLSRLNFSYDLPGGISAYSWVDLRVDSTGFYGESNFERKTPLRGVNAKVQVNYPNDAFGRLGVGFSVPVPYLPKNMKAKLSFFPLFFDNSGARIERDEINYSFQIELPQNMRFI